MWNLAVPKIMHTYWGGDVLPYIRYKTIESFIRHNPDWEVWVWTSNSTTKEISWTSREHKYKTPCTNFIDKLWELPVHKYIIDLDKLGFGKDISEVYKADITRIYVLNEIGGTWSDMDVIYFAPIEKIYVNLPEHHDKNIFACVSHYGHSTGFMMSVKGSEFFDRLFKAIGNEYNPTHYQCLGPSMFDKYWPRIADIPKCINISMDVVYAHDANHIHELITSRPSRFTNRSIGCHWYAGHLQWGPFINKTDGGLTNLAPSIITNLLKDDIHIREQRNARVLSKKTANRINPAWEKRFRSY